MNNPHKKEKTQEFSPSGEIQLVQSAEIDQQIATAKKYPREVNLFRARTRDMCLINEKIAGECIFALPRGDKPIKGPSVRFAEILISNWTNCRVASQGIREEKNFVISQGGFQDLESNTVVVKESRRPILYSNGGRYNEDMINMTANAASSIAIRNAILTGIPRALWDDIWEEANKMVMGSAETLGSRRPEMLNYLMNFNITPELACSYVKKRKVEDIDIDDMVVLRALANSLKDGDETRESLIKKYGLPEKDVKQKSEPVKQKQATCKPVEPKTSTVKPSSEELKATAEGFQEAIKPTGAVSDETGAVVDDGQQPPDDDPGPQELPAGFAEGSERVEF